jgi:predicted nucleotide-binding protein
MTIRSALRDLNSALLDLQAADYNTFERPLKRMAAALSSEALKEIVEELKAGVDFDAFISNAQRDQLDWPTEREKELGLAIVLIERAASDPHWFLNFGHTFYQSASTKIIASVQKVTSSVFIPFNRDFAAYVESKTPTAAIQTELPSDLRRVFIVHGHDEAPRETVARFIATIGLEPVILHEQANRGMTIPEKLIAYGNVGFAVILLTPDDLGRAKDASEESPRARQNVILELGYFVGRLGRDRVCGLLKGELEIPSDYLGVAYTTLDEGGGWRQELARELQAAGYEIDWNKVMR